MVPRLLTEEQKAQRLNACRDILQQMEADEKLLENVITGDERSTTFGRGKKGADNKGATKRAKNKKGAQQKGHRTKRAQNKKRASSRCCVTVTFKVVISSDNRVLSQSFFFFFFCRNIIHSLRLHCLKYVSIKSLKTEESYNTKL